jgi:hypothetical protein
MTPDEKNALISFFGNIHSMAKQTDGSVVERSKFVAPISNTVKRELENVLTTEQAAAHYAPAAPVAQSQTIYPVDGEMQVLQVAHPVFSPQPVVNENEVQLELNFTKRDADTIIDILKRIESKINKIATILNRDDRETTNTKKEANIKVPRLSSSGK